MPQAIVAEEYRARIHSSLVHVAPSSSIVPSSSIEDPALVARMHVAFIFRRDRIEPLQDFMIGRNVFRFESSEAVSFELAANHSRHIQAKPFQLRA